MIEDSSGNIYRMAVDKDYDCMFLVMMDLDTMNTRILEDDIVNVVSPANTKNIEKTTVWAHSMV